MNVRQFCVVLVIFMTAAACQPQPTAAPSQAPQGTATTAVSTAQTAPTQAAATLPAPTAAGLALLQLSGDTWLISDPIAVDGETTLAVTWDYAGSGPFAVWLVNTAEEVPDPAYDRILVVDAEGAGAGTQAIPVIPGEYELEVEMADGPWTVVITGPA